MVKKRLTNPYGTAVQAPTEPAKSPLVVLIDDEPVVLRTMARALTAEGFRVETAADGEAGFDMVMKLRPSAVVTDLNMPVVSGQHLVALIRLSLGEEAPPIVVLTADVDAKCDEAVCVLRKPFGFSHLVNVLRPLVEVASSACR